MEYTKLTKLMPITPSGRLLLLLARYLDYHERVVSVSRTLRYLAGDRRVGRHRRWAEEYLEQRQRLHQTVHNLKRRGYLQEKVFGKTQGYILTPKGETRLLALKLMDASAQKQLPNGQWLMAFFDVPESRRREREMLRANLKRLDFEPLQKSVWVTRVDVRGELRRWLTAHQLAPCVRLLIVREFVR